MVRCLTEKAVQILDNAIGGRVNLKNYPKYLNMKTKAFAFILSSLFLSISCSAQQPPQWVYDLVSENLTITASEITFWEEKQMTFHGVNTASDSLVANALYVEGRTSEGRRFIAKIAQANQTITPLGMAGLIGDSCTGMCGCQCCQFRPNSPGCYCDSAQGCCVEQLDCNCWCQHVRDYLPKDKD